MSGSVNRASGALFQVLERYIVPCAKKNDPTLVKVSLAVNRARPKTIHYVEAKNLPIFNRVVYDISRKTGVPISVWRY